MEAARQFSVKLKTPINKSTVRGIKKDYVEERSKRLRNDEDVEIHELPAKKQGRPLLLGVTIDTAVQEYILKVRERGCVVNTAVVIAAVQPIAMVMDKNMISEKGGLDIISVPWEKSLLKRMDFTKRKGSSKTVGVPGDLDAVKNTFLCENVSTVEMEEIPGELIFNWDQTGIPVHCGLYRQKREKRIEIAGFQDKRQITAVMCCTLMGEIL